MPSIEDLKKIVAQNILDLRRTKGISQRKLEELAKADLRLIQRAEKGESNLTLDVLCRIANGLEVSPARLLQSSDIDFPEPPEKALTPAQATELAVSVLKRYKSSIE